MASDPEKDDAFSRGLGLDDEKETEKRGGSSSAAPATPTTTATRDALSTTPVLSLGDGATPKLWTRRMFRLYGILLLGYLCIVLQGFDGSLMPAINVMVSLKRRVFFFEESQWAVANHVPLPTDAV